MKKLNISWEGVGDTTGYLFSFAKCLSAAVRHSPYHELAEDIVASSGLFFGCGLTQSYVLVLQVWSFKRKPW